jgi:hypothetical protein
MAGRPCSICQHPDAPSVDQALVNHRPFRRISVQFGVSLSAVIRHHDDHLPATLAAATAAEETARADDLLDQVKGLRNKALSLLLAAEKSGDLKTALMGVREARACVELLAEMMQAIDRRPTLNVLLSPEWLQVRAVVLDVLRDDPGRRLALVERLEALERPA